MPFFHHAAKEDICLRKTKEHAYKREYSSLWRRTDSDLGGRLRPDYLGYNLKFLYVVYLKVDRAAIHGVAFYFGGSYLYLFPYIRFQIDLCTG